MTGYRTGALLSWQAGYERLEPEWRDFDGPCRWHALSLDDFSTTNMQQNLEGERQDVNAPESAGFGRQAPDCNVAGAVNLEIRASRSLRSGIT